MGAIVGGVDRRRRTPVPPDPSFLFAKVLDLDVRVAVVRPVIVAEGRIVGLTIAVSVR